MLRWHLLWSVLSEIHRNSGQRLSPQQDQGLASTVLAWLYPASSEYRVGAVCHCFSGCRPVATAVGDSPVAAACAWPWLSVRGCSRFAHPPLVFVCQYFPSPV